MRVLVVRRQKAIPLTSTKIQKWTDQIVRGLPVQDSRRAKSCRELSVVFVEKKEARQLNHRYRRRNYATDVLSFSPVEEESLGELVFCYPVIKKQAREHDLSVNDEFLYLLIHGFLHLLGYEHEKSKKAAEKMFRLQDQLFDLLRKSRYNRDGGKSLKKKMRK